MKRLILIIILFMVQSVFADKMDYLFNQGVEAYQNGKYNQAIEHFNDALNQDYESAELYYNLGNAYYKTGEIGQCILNYERAKELSPHDDDILFNLKIAQLQVVDKIPSPEVDYLFRLWRNIIHFFSLSQLSILTLVLYILSIGVLIVRLLIKSAWIQKTAPYILAPLFIFFVIFALFFGLRLHEELHVKEAVIMTDKVNVMSSPAKDSVEVFALHEGVKVRVMDHSGDFVRIRLTDGKDGWVLANSLEII